MTAFSLLSPTLDHRNASRTAGIRFDLIDLVLVLVEHLVLGDTAVEILDVLRTTEQVTYFLFL